MNSTSILKWSPFKVAKGGLCNVDLYLVGAQMIRREPNSFRGQIDRACPVDLPYMSRLNGSYNDTLDFSKANVDRALTRIASGAN